MAVFRAFTGTFLTKLRLRCRGWVCVLGIKGGGGACVASLPLRGVLVRRRATLPHPVGCSTIAVPGLRFRVRNGSGRLPWAMAAANLQLSVTPFLGGPGCVVVRGPVGGRDARVFVTVDQVCGWSG